LGGPNEGLLVAPLQKFRVLPERADFVEKLSGAASSVYY
jgi:hypothetical protein